MLCCVVVGSVSTISFFEKAMEVGYLCCLEILAPFRVSCAITNDEFELLLLFHSLNVALYVKSVVRL